MQIFLPQFIKFTKFTQVYFSSHFDSPKKTKFIFLEEMLFSQIHLPDLFSQPLPGDLCEIFGYYNDIISFIKFYQFFKSNKYTFPMQPNK